MKTTTNALETKTTSELATMYAEQSKKIAAAGAAGRSVSTMNRLWREYFRIEDALKAASFGGF